MVPDTNYPYASTIPPSGAHVKIIETHSPVTLEVYDGNGLHTGPAPNPDPDSNLPYVEEQIPNSAYFKIGESTYIALGVDDTHRVVVTGYDTGTFTLKIKEMIDDVEINSAIYKNIPVLPDLRAEFNIQTIDDISEVNIDIDGDGVFDTSLSGNVGETALSSLQILSGMINDMEIDKKLKKKLLKYTNKAEKKLGKKKTKKTVRELEKMIDKLEEEIEENLKDEDDEYEDKHDKQKNHKNGKSHHYEDEKDDEDEDDDEKEKISTQNALMLINIIRGIIGMLV